MKTMKLQIRTCQRPVVLLLIKILQTECCSVIGRSSITLCMLNTIYGQKKTGKSNLL